MIKSLEHCGYKVSFFEGIDQAKEYILDNIKGVTVGFGDSETLASMNLAKCLAEYNEVVDPSSYSGETFLEIGKKASSNTKSKFLKVYIDKYSPVYAIRVLGKNFGMTNGMLDRELNK